MEYMASAEAKPFNARFMMAKMLILIEITHSDTGTQFSRPARALANGIEPVLTLSKGRNKSCLACASIMIPVSIASLIFLPQEWEEHLECKGNSYAISLRLDVSGPNLVVLPWCVTLSDNKDSSRQIAFLQRSV
jgi:hypothetical protein